MTPLKESGVAMSTAENELLALYARTRDAEAFQALVEKHCDMVFATSKRIVGETADAEDISQDCFILLSRHAARLRAPVAGWLHTVAVRISLKFVRDRRVRHRHEAHAAAERGAPREESWDDVQRAVDEAIMKLPERFRTPVILHYLERRTQEEIAAELRISQSAVSKRLNRGVELLRKRLRCAGFTAPAAVLAGLLVSKIAEGAPPSLVASLGKLSLSGVPTATKLAAANIGIVTGVSAMKIGIATVVVAAAMVVGSVVVHGVSAQAPAPVIEAAPAPQPDLDLPPCAVKTVPADRAKDVDFDLQEIKVTFDRPMTTEKSWSWILHEDLGVYPGYRGGPDPQWEDDGRTCVLAVKLSPDTLYAIGVNSFRHHGFKDTQGKNAVPHVWVFKTKKAQ